VKHTQAHACITMLITAQK